MNYNYLVPANSKKQGLIFAMFAPLDLIILITGVVITFLLFLLVSSSSIVAALLSILPAFIAIFSVFPIPNYRNTRIFLKELYKFYFVKRRKYIWRGWCYKYDNSNE